MLPTFVIGLREGLEAALIVSIIATFLRHNGARLRGMWLGVAAGVALSIAVGVVLRLVEQSLPQAGQEGMETVIGAVAVFFVTGMILWMRTHARTMKADLHRAAAGALHDGTTTALGVMAFLAVLREGFETSVFLLATFSSAGSAPAAMVGAVLGIGVAVALGWGMYAGGVRINLQRFFSVTGVFLVLVAAGLVLNAFRTGHEAGWVTVGQQRTVDLAWLAPVGSIRSALVTGVLGIQPDPRLIEVLAWACYLVPMLALMFWPRRLRPGRVLAQRLRVAGAAAAVLAAVLLAALVPAPRPTVPAQAPVSSGGTATLTVRDGAAALRVGGTLWELTRTSDAMPGADTGWQGTPARTARPDTLTARQLVALDGGRIPSGLSLASAPGPYDARWRDQTGVRAWSRDGGLVDAVQTGQLTLTYSGGGLTTPRVLTIPGWRLDPDYVATTAAAIAAADARAHDRLLWRVWVPVSLGLVAVVLIAQSRRHRAKGSGAPSTVVPSTPGHPSPAAATAGHSRDTEGTPHHADLA